MVEKIKHPDSEKIIVGTRLKPGEKIKASDVRHSVSGTWIEAPAECIGMRVLENSTVVWVRPAP